MLLRQHAVHSNGTKKITYQGCAHSESCTNTGANNHSDNGQYSNHSNSGYSDHRNNGYSNHSNGGYSNHSNGCGNCSWGDWHDSWGGCSQSCHQHKNSGCGNHTNNGANNHTNTGANNHTDTGANNHTNTGYSNHTNTYNYSNGYAAANTTSTPINSNTPSAKLNSSLSDKGVNLAKNIITLDLSSAVTSASAYRVYVKKKMAGSSSFSNWTLLLDNQRTTTVNIDISSWPQGSVQFIATAYNGSSWSAIPINSGASWTYDHHQALKPSDNTAYTTTSALPKTGKTGKTSTRTQVTVSDTTQYEIVGGSYAVSNVLQIIRYTPPTWLTNPWAKETTDQLHDEINKALKNFTGETYTFANVPIVQNWTVIKIDDLKDMQSQVNKLMTAAGKSTVDFSSKDYMSGKARIVKDTALKDLQDLMDSLGK